VRQKERAAALAEANKVRTDKKVSTPEMIVDLPLSLSDTIKLQTGTLLQSLNVEHHIWEAPVENAIKWRRKVTSRFDSELGFWEPILPRIEDEHHVAVLMTAEKFVELAMGNGVSEHVATVSQHFPHHHVIYLLEGVAAWIRRNRNVRNRRFASGVRSQEAPAASTSRARQTTAEYISEDVVEDALLELQVMHNVFIHHTAVPLETAQWITVLTQHISTIPYRKQKDQATLGAGFCMETGQVKTGDDAKDTYVRLLQEIVRVTAPIAYGVAAEFGTVSALVRGLEEGGPSTLENIRKSANKDGAFSDRTVGQAVSKRMYKVFTGQDEGSTDV
jgi:crossover junction endonuclease EME1